MYPCHGGVFYEDGSHAAQDTCQRWPSRFDMGAMIAFARWLEDRVQIARRSSF